MKIKKNDLSFQVLLFILSITLFFSFLPSNAQAENQPQTYYVYANYIPGLLEDENTGVFAELNEEVSRRSKYNLVLIFFPPKRLRQAFEMKEIDIAYPMLPSSFDDRTPYYSSSSFYKKRDYVFTRKESPLVKTMEELEKIEGKVGLTLGYSYPSILLNNPHIQFDYTKSDEANMIKLHSKRIDAFVVEELSGLSALSKTGFKEYIHYDETSPLYTQDVFYAFQKEERLIEVVQAVSKAIDEMKQDGTLEKILFVLHPPGGKSLY